MLNKKGSLSMLLILLVIAVIATVIFSIAFVFSNTFKLYAIGISIIIITLIYGFNSPVNKQKSKVMIIGILLGTGFILIPALGIFQTIIPTGNYIQAPTFYYYECNAASQPVESLHTVLATGSSNGWITCPSNTDQCDLIVSQTEKTAWYSTERRLAYQICHASGSCDPVKYEYSPQWLPWEKSLAPSVRISNLLSTDKVWVNYQARNLLLQWKDQPNGAEWFQNYKPFILWKVDMFNGGRTEYTTVQQGCNFPSTGNLINSVTNSIKQISEQSSTSNTNLPFYKTRNFIGTYVPISTSNVNFVTYNGQQGYCLNRQIFAITTVTTNDNTYQIVDSNFNTRLANSVTCCPGETQTNQKCNSNFQWENIVNAECSAFKACAGADWMISSSKTLVRYNCIESKCVPETKQVSCTYNSDCGSNQVCDTKTYTCINVIPGEIIPNKTITQDDTCKWYQEYLTKSTTSYKWYDIFKTNPQVTTTTGCYTSSIATIIIIGVILIFVLVGVIVYYMPKKNNRRKRK